MAEMEKFTLEQYAQMIKQTKPYLVALQELVDSVDYGQVEVVLEVRAGIVEKMVVVNHKVWLRPKPGHNQDGFVAMSVEQGVEYAK